MQSSGFFASGDFRSLAEAMSELILSKDERDSLGPHGKEYFLRNNRAVQKQDYLGLIDSLSAR